MQPAPSIGEDRLFRCGGTHSDLRLVGSVILGSRLRVVVLLGLQMGGPDGRDRGDDVRHVVCSSSGLKVGKNTGRPVWAARPV